MKFSDVIKRLGAVKSYGDPNLDLNGVGAIENTKPGQISYIGSEKFVSFIAATQASALILPKHDELQSYVTSLKIAWMEVPDPRLAFADRCACRD